MKYYDERREIKKGFVCIALMILLICTQVYTVAAEELKTSDGYLYEENTDGTITITGYVGTKTELEIPKSINGKSVISIGNEAFQECTSLKSVVIPQGVKTIGDDAFWGCMYITSIDIPNSVTSIGKNAFGGCFELPSIDIPNSVTSIGEEAFAHCYKLTSITIPHGVTRIEEATFEECESLKNVKIPNSVTSIGPWAFYSCNDLESIKISEGVKSIGYWAFAFSGNLVNVEISNSVTHIDECAFGYCDNLSSVKMSKNLSSIDERAFEGCDKSKTIFYVYPDAYAKTWAIENGYKTSIIETSVTYHTHIQSYGDSQGTKKNGEMAGTSGEAKRLENIWIDIEGNDNLGVQYSTHCQSYGWMPWSCDGETNGTSGEAKRLEAIKIQLTGADKDKYDIYYRVHAQSYGWLGWAKNGEPSGTAGYAKRLEGIQVVVVKKGEAGPALNYAGVDGSSSKYSTQPYVAATQDAITIPGDASAPIVSYKTHVQSFGWQKWVHNGAMSGTSGQAKRLEGINIKVTNCPYDGDIVYTTHVQTYGWQGKPDDATRTGWKKNGEMSGTSGEAKRLEAICIDLTGERGEKYDIYYRVHAQSFGWLGWAKNGEESGTAGYGKRLEGIQIVLVPKGGAAPANDFGGVTSTRTEGYIAK